MEIIDDIYKIVKDLYGDWRRRSVYLRRTSVNWEKYNKKTQNRYWVCGTSLVGVANNGVIERFLDARVYDLRVVLPETENGNLSRWQLQCFNKIKVGPFEKQVLLAKMSYQRIKQLFTSYGVVYAEHLRKYTGIMYSNITIYDNDAFISFYDPTGVGDNNITLHFHGRESDEYHCVEELFLQMWDPNHNLGIRKGTSILFVNTQNEILLLLRDDDADRIEYPNCWDIPGGHVEENESPEQCIIREMKEEIGKDIVSPQLYKISDMEDRLEHTYWAKADWNPEEITLTEGKQLKWFTVEGVRNLSEDKIAFGFKSIILQFFEEAPFK